MNPYELALARQRTYALFGNLFLQGVTAELAPQVAALPELGELLPQPFDADIAAATHYHLTTAVVLPFESIFRDPSGLLGGPVSEQVTTRYHHNDFDVSADPDHIGHELLFMAQLCALEGRALQQDNSNAASLWQARQQAFLTLHLLAWLPPFVAAVQLSGLPFYGRLAGLTLELVADHLGMQPSAAPFALPEAPALASDESGLKDMAAFLTTPPYCGFYLSRDAISALARSRQLPRGFGNRRQMLTNLLRAAGQYNQAVALMNDLTAGCAAWAECYRDQAASHVNAQPWIQPWRERVDQTAVSLEDIRQAIVAMNAGPSF